MDEIREFANKLKDEISCLENRRRGEDGHIYIPLDAVLKTIEKNAEEKKKIPVLYSKVLGLYGECGKPTAYKDVYGTTLSIGDVVKVSKTYTTAFAFVASHGSRDFIMGIFSDCADGKVLNGWRIEKVQDWSRIKEGEHGEQSETHIVVKYMAREEVEALKAKQKEEYAMPEFEDV